MTNTVFNKNRKNNCCEKCITALKQHTTETMEYTNVDEFVLSVTNGTAQISVNGGDLVTYGTVNTSHDRNMYRTEKHRGDIKVIGSEGALWSVEYSKCDESDERDNPIPIVASDFTINGRFRQVPNRNGNGNGNVSEITPTSIQVIQTSVPTTVALAPGVTTLTIPNEGTWTVQGLSLLFTPIPYLIRSPTPVTYMLIQGGLVSNDGTVTILHPIDALE